MSAASWESDGACRSYDAEIFFPIAYQANRPDVKAAKAICCRCPVLDDCRDWALANPWWSSDGIWAAMTPPERARARRTANPERTAAA